MLNSKRNAVVDEDFIGIHLEWPEWFIDAFLLVCNAFWYIHNKALMSALELVVGVKVSLSY